MTTAMSSCTMRVESANHLTHACHCLRFVTGNFFFFFKKENYNFYYDLKFQSIA